MPIALGLNPAWAGPATTVNLATAAFSPTANSLIIIDAHIDLADAAPLSFTPAITDSVGLTWNAIGTTQRGNSGGWVMSWWTYTATSQTNMTVSVNWNGSGANKTIKARTFTETATTGAVISNTQNSANTNNLTVNTTNTNDGCRIAGTAIDWNARGLPASTDDEVGYHLNGAISGLSVHKEANTTGTGVTVSLNFDGGGNQGTSWGYKIYEIVPAPTGGGTTTVTVNQIAETDTAQLVTKKKINVVGQVIETGTPQTITSVRRKDVLQVIETDTAQPIVFDVANVVNTVGETDTSQTITRRKIRTTTFPVESDTAQPIRPIHRRTIGPVIETDTVTIIGKRKLRTIGQTGESDTALSIKLHGRVTLVLETDIAQPIRSIKRKTLGQPTETSTALTATPTRLLLVAVNTAMEVDSPTTLRVIKRLTISTIEETDLARVITPRTELAPPPDGIIISVVVKPTTVDVFVSPDNNVVAKAYNVDVTVAPQTITVNL